ncbi:MAG: metalloregulator ArsR/SmtB family transcription factor [Deltaproteobacteria bacterium]
MAYHSTDLDAIFTALADPTRRAVLDRLTRGPASASDLAEEFDMTLQNFLAHLKKLSEAGLITSEKSGRVRTLALIPEALQPVRQWLDVQRDLWTARLDQFDNYVMRLHKERTRGPGPKD